MPSFSLRSTLKLSQCHPDLRRVFEEVVKRYDCTIIEGARTDEEQAELLERGLTKVGPGESKHNIKPLSHAVDAAPYPIDWKNMVRFYAFAGYVLGTADAMGIKLRWGGDWDGDRDFGDQTFMDLVHFELA